MEKIKVRKEILRFSQEDVIAALREKFGVDIPDGSRVKQVNVKADQDWPTDVRRQAASQRRLLPKRTITMFEVKVIDVEED